MADIARSAANSPQASAMSDTARLTALLDRMAALADRWDRLATYELPSSPYAAHFAEVLRSEVLDALHEAQP